MLVCRVCGRVNHEDYLTCPRCHSDDFREATECKICGELFFDEDNLDVCENCIDDYCNVGTALKYGESCTEDVEINGAIRALLTEEEINNILTKYVEEHFTDDSKDVAEFCTEDKQNFAEWLVERQG